MPRSPDFFRFIRAQRRGLGPHQRAAFFTALLHAAAPGAGEALASFGEAGSRGDSGIDIPGRIARQLADDPLLAGWAYQLWNEPERKASSWGVSRRGEEQRERLEITAATQIFTDEQMGAFLCERARAHGKLRADLIDPACGAGHLLVQAFRSRWAQRDGETAEAILAQLFGLDIDPFAAALCRGVLAAEAVRLGGREISAALAVTSETIVALENPLGTLERDTSSPMLQRRYGCVLANPPYLGRRKLAVEVRDFLDREYPDSALDLCAAFVQRCLELLEPEGFFGLVSHDKWLRLKGYRALRNGGKNFAGIYRALELDALCELGKRAFDRQLGLHDGLGVVLLSALHRQAPAGHALRLVSLADESDNEKKSVMVSALLAQLGEHARLLPQERLTHEPHDRIFMEGAGLPAALLCSARRVEREATVVVGLQTNDDRRFVRNQWEVVPDPLRWRVHSKGGGYGRWFGLNRTVLDWGEGRRLFESSPRSGIAAEQWFEKPGWVYSWFANGNVGLRQKDAGWSFGRAASSGLFCQDERIVAFLNSSLGSLCARRLGGKVQLPEGVVRRLPLPESLDGISVALVRAAADIKRELVRAEIAEITFEPEHETDVLERIALEALLRAIEGQLELQVRQSLGVSPGDISGERGPVALWPMAEGVPIDAFWSLVPRRFIGLRSALDGVVALPRRGKFLGELEPDRLRLVMRGGGAQQGARLELPADGWLERLCGVLRRNPIELAVLLAQECSRRADVRRALELPAAEQGLFVSLAKSVGHLFWSEPQADTAEPPRTLTLKEATALLSSSSQAARLEAAAGMAPGRWLETSLEAWQRKVFGSQGPVLVERGPTIRFSSIQRAGAATPQGHRRGGRLASGAAR